MNVKKYGQWIFSLAILLISVKAITFTRDLVLANYFLHENKEKAAAYMYRILCDKPFLYHALRDNQKTLVDNYIVKKAIYARFRDNKNVFAAFSRGSQELTAEHFKARYRDNFYLQYLFPPAPSQPNWKNLDAVSLELLADKTLNSLTLTLWEKVKPFVDPKFAANLADYCRWQGNTELAERLGKDIEMAKPVLNAGSHTGRKSFKQLLITLKKKKKLTIDDLRENRPGSEDFNDMGAFKEKWEFSCMTSGKDIRGASFTMGLDGSGENRYLRLMGFFAGGGDGGDGSDKTKPSARGGAIYKETIPLSRGYYLLSFDYLTVTGREKPSFYLWKGISEAFLPPTGGNWKKAVYFLNNSTGGFTGIKPIFRMWGTGTVLIDNVYCAAVTNPTFGFSRMALLYISGWK